MSVITNSFTFVRSKIKSKFLVFRESILFYPLVFTLIALILFIITSYIDGILFSDTLSIDTAVLDSLIFTGSADAARTILSTIGSGWATILGVAFSVTLITLSLSTSKYTSHLIDRFEQDKINQITLGWFIFIVAYSLLVLKTVRTEDLQFDNLVPLLNNVSTSNMSGLANFDPSTTFVPVIGVNIAVIIAIVGLFIFVLFLKNISSYLRPNMLISSIITSIVDSLKSYSDRNTTEETINKANAFKLMDLQSNSTGLVTRIDWDKINKTIHEEIFIESSKKDDKNFEFTPKDEKMIENEYHYWLEWSKPLGKRVNKNDVFGILYKYKKNDRSESAPDDMGENKSENNFGQNIENNHYRSDHKHNKKNHSQKQNDKIHSNIISAVQVEKDRSINSDPLYGIDLIQSIAVKASNSRDIDVVISCISGLFDILRFILDNGDPMGRPFKLCKLDRKGKGPKLYKDRQKKIISLESKTGDIKKENDGKNKVSNLDSKNGLSGQNTQRTSTDPFSLIIDPKENSLIELILSELSVINSTSKTNDKIHIFNGLIGEYIRLGMYLVRSDKIDEFIMFTEWISYQIENASNVFNRDLADRFVINELVEFKKQLFDSGNSSMYNSFVIIIDPLLEEFTLTYDNKT
ncbi:hypothetical protein BH23THE1_BH23THE1_18730 [soil metagenome]